MSHSRRSAELIVELFKGNPHWIAVFESGSETPQPKNLFRPITADDLLITHFKDTCLGVYLVNPDDDTVLCSCLDFDGHAGDADKALSDAKTAYQFLDDNGLSPVMEISQSGTGAHVWLFFDSPVQASAVRQFWMGVHQQTQTYSEIYPKQDSVAHLDRRLGNLVRLPLWRQSHFTDVDLKPLDTEEVLEGVKRHSPYTIQSRAETWYVPHTSEGPVLEFETEGLPTRVAEILEEDPAGTLAKRWAFDVDGMNDTSRSAIIGALAVELVRKMVPTPEIEATLRYWRDQHGSKMSEQGLHRTILSAYSKATGLETKRSRSVSTMAAVMHNSLDSLAGGLLIPSGVSSLDRATRGGLETGEFGIIAARPSNGKTALALEWLDNAARQGFRSLFVSLDMHPRQITKRILTRMGYTTEQVDSMGRAELEKLIVQYFDERAPMYFDSDARHIDQIEELVEMHTYRNGIKLVVIDYAGLIDTGRADMTSYASQSEVSIRVAAMAERFDVACLLLVQLGRQGDSKPDLRDLKGSGQFEQDADQVLACVWPWQSGIEGVDREAYEVHVLKNRNRGIEGPEVALRFDSDTQTFKGW